MFLRTPALLYACGSLAALLTLFAQAFAAGAGLHQAVGVSLSPLLSAAYVAPRLVEGGCLAAIFLLPIPFRYSLLGLPFVALGPACYRLLVVFPQWEHAGYLGLRHGWATPLVVYAYALLWALLTSLGMRATGGR